jgi:hypothetical protein
MKRNNHALAIIAMLSVWLSVSSRFELWAESIASPEPSQYAPLVDLHSQVDYFLQRIEDDLSDEDSYGDDHRGRVEKDASTLAALGLILAKHDKDHPLKRSGARFIEASAKLADAAGDFSQAQSALKEVKAVKSDPAGDGGPVEWEPVANLAVLMQQVPIVSTNLQRGLSGQRFNRSIDRNAGFATTLAAVAQASLLDTDYCEDEEAEKKWQAICAEMRDAAAAINVAVRNKDQSAAQSAATRLNKTCDACHHEFRD